MIKRIGMKKYKCFDEQTNMEIAPLTLLCGVNSSGKSSILKSILMMKQTTESKSPDPALVMAGPYVDNGTFDDVICSKHLNDEKSFTLQYSFDICNHKIRQKGGRYIRRQDAKAFNELRRLYNSIPESIDRFCIDLEIVIQKQQGDENEFSQYISDNSIMKYTINIHAKNLDGEVIDNSIGFIVFKNDDNCERHMMTWKNIPGYANKPHSYEDYICTCSFSGLAITSVFAYNMPNSVKSVIPNILLIVRLTFAQFEGVSFIAPLRQNPERTYLIKGNVSSVGLSGENTAMLLAKIKNRLAVNDFEFMRNGKRIIRQNQYHEIIQYWLDYFEMGKLNITGEKGAITITLDQHNISDIGFGVSQVLPIITQGIYMSKEETLLIEQPEIHLHPKMELQMADFLLEMAKSERNIVVETHSDHIVNRVIHRVMENFANLSSLVKIYFIENSENGSVIHPPIQIDRFKGSQTEYPDFFTQYTTESREIMAIGLENMLGKNK